MNLDEYVTFRKDLNNGAGLYAVFIGDVPIHHFKPEGNKPHQYMDRVKVAIEKIFLAYQAK